MPEEKGPGEIYCGSCGEVIKREAEICPHCGVGNPEASANKTTRRTSSNHDSDDIVARASPYIPYAAWAFGALFILSGVVSLIDTPITGVMSVLTGAFILPPSREKVEEYLRENYDIELSTWMVIGIILIGLVLVGATAPNTGQTSGTSSQSQVSNGGASQNSQAAQGVQVRISYSGSWSGAVGTEGSMRVCV